MLTPQGIKKLDTSLQNDDWTVATASAENAHMRDSAIQDPVFEPLLDVHGAAALLEMHWKTLEGMARKGTVPAFRIGGRWRFRASLLNLWLEKRLVSPRPDGVQWCQPAAPRESGEQQ